jgi:hypothetical protein
VSPYRHIVLEKLSRFFSGKITRRTLLVVVIPLILVSYFGILALAVLLFPAAYDWRTVTISKLLYPRNNPQFHSVASFGIVVTGFLVIPFAGYMNRRLRMAAPAVASVAATALAGGAVFLVFSGLISSHPAQGHATVPKLHEFLARIATIGIGAGLVLFDACAMKGHFHLPTGRKLYPRSLLILWNLAAIPAILVVAFKLAMYAHVQSLAPMARALRGTAAWHLGFWEWIGSAAVVLFLACAAWLLPEHPGD